MTQGEPISHHDDGPLQTSSASDFSVPYLPGRDGKRTDTGASKGMTLSGLNPVHREVRTEVTADGTVTTVAESTVLPTARPNGHGHSNGNGNGNGEVHAKAKSMADSIQIARLKGYEGDACSECGNFTLLRNGSCLKCATCGSTTGCS
jgi:hypothetical protein